jgi:ribulose-phosphate 3-epimerase
VNWTDVGARTVEPSIYAADFARLGAALDEVMNAGARIFHFDVGDGHFVEPITVGPIVLQSIAPLVHERGGLLDCHLMVDNPERHFPQIARAGGDSVTFHYEVSIEPAATAAQARDLGLGVGLVFNPETRVEPAVEAALAAGVDLVLCMSIHPGYSGQTLLPESFERLARARELLPETIHLQVDGGVTLANIERLRDAGANLFVAGSSVFGGADPGAAYEALARAVA